MLTPQLLVELVEGSEDHCGDIEKDREHSLHPQQIGDAEGQLYVIVTVTAIHKVVHSLQDEADGIHGHTPPQGRLVQVQVSVADEGEDDTGHIVLQPPERTWEAGHEADHVAGSDTDPGHFDGIKQSSHAGEGGSGDGVVLGGAWRKELDVGGAEDEGSHDADDGEAEGISMKKTIPGAREGVLQPA